MLTGDEIAQAGEALFGVHWRAELARALGLNDEAQIRAVEAGYQMAPESWRGRLIAIAQDAALRAMDVAGSLLWREADEEACAAPAYAPQMS